MNKYSIIVSKTNAKIKSNLSKTQALEVVSRIKDKKNIETRVISQPFDLKLEGQETYMKIKEQYLKIGYEAQQQYGDILYKEEKSLVKKLFGF